MKKTLAFLSVLYMLTAPINAVANNIQVYAEVETESSEIWGETENFNYKIVGNEIELTSYKKGITSVLKSIDLSENLKIIGYHFMAKRLQKLRNMLINMKYHSIQLKLL